jgi:hypothetical protein
METPQNKEQFFRAMLYKVAFLVLRLWKAECISVAVMQIDSYWSLFSYIYKLLTEKAN